MLRIDRLCVWIFILGFALMVVSLNILRFGDELVVYSLLGLAMVDCIVNGAWRRYRLLLIFIAVMAIYTVYSLTVVHYNTSASILLGVILEMKPFIPILIFMAVAPTVGDTEKRILRGIAVFNGILIIASIPIMNSARALVWGHNAMYGGSALVSAVIYLYCSIDPEKGFTRRGLLIFSIIMLAGLFSTRSKYYAEFCVAIFLITVYRQQMLRHLTAGQLIGLILFGCIVVAATWGKLYDYFVSGIDLSALDLTRMDEFARLALYGMMPTVLMMHPVMGTGLASYGSYASGDPGYSAIYGELGMDKIYGLSPSNHDFICDAYYPSLAQYGIVGIMLFVWFWVKVYSYLRPLTRRISPETRATFIIGCLALASILIEMTTGTLVFMAPGEVLAMLLGIICGTGRTLKTEAPDTTPDVAKSTPPARIA